MNKSVYSDINDLLKMKNRFRNFPKKFPFIAEGEIKDSYGVVELSNKDSHINWWIFEDIFNKLPQLFSLAKGVSWQ